MNDILFENINSYLISKVLASSVFEFTKLITICFHNREFLIWIYKFHVSLWEVYSIWNLSRMYGMFYFMIYFISK